MISNMIRNIFHILIALLIVGCSSDGPSGDGNDRPDGGTADIVAHPRLLLTAGEEMRIKSAIQRFPELMKTHTRIMDFARIYLSQPPVEYKLEGKRLLETSQEAMKRIFYLSYAYRMTGSEAYVTRAEEELKAVCTFPDWNPSHFLDVAEMTAGVAIGYDWLYDKLSADTRRTVREAIVEKGLRQSQDTRFAWFYNATSNWNSVCNAGMVYGALATYESNITLSRAIIDKCRETNVKALEVYGPDGGYPEGHSYWNYGAGYEALLIAGMESALGTDYGLSETPGFMESASYVQYMECPSGQSFNYSDCTTAVDVNPALFWFACKTADPSLVCLELGKIGASSVRWSDGRLLPLIMIYGSRLAIGNPKPPTGNYWYSGGKTPVYVYRTWDTGSDAIYLGIKGGSASTDHAHMDAGSFIFERHGQRWACDLQRQNYNSLESQGVDLWNMKQNSQRWDLLRIGNMGHSTLTVNGEKHLVDGMAEIIGTYMDNDRKGATIDLSSTLRGLDEAYRTITLDASDNLTVTDRVKAPADKDAQVRWQMMTPATARISGKTITLTLGGKTMKLTADAGELALNMTVWDNTPDNNFEEDNPGTCRVGFTTTVPAGREATLTVTLK